MMSYSEQVMNIHAVTVEAHDKRVWDLSGEISEEESEAGRDTSNILACRVSEFQKVHKTWSL